MYYCAMPESEKNRDTHLTDYKGTEGENVPNDVLVDYLGSGCTMSF